MANGNRVIARGPSGPSRMATLGAAFGGGLQETLSQSIPRAVEMNRRARELNPLREAILQQIESQGGQTNPAQAMIMAQAQDPVGFARMMENPQRLQSTAAISQMLSPEQDQEPRRFTRVVSSDSELNGRFDLGIPDGEHARVEFEYTNEGIRPVGVQGRFVTEGGGSGLGAGGPFGSSRKGRAWNIMVDLAPGFADGSLTSEEERTFHSAVAQVRERRTDPDSGLEIVPSVPDFVEDAYRTRSTPIPGIESDITTRPGTDRSGQGQGQTPASAPPANNMEESATRLSEMGGGSGEEAALGRQQTQEQYRTVPPDAQIPEWGQGRTIAHEVMNGNVSGPAPAVARWLARFPGLGIRFPEQTSAKRTLDIANRRLVTALQQNPRYAEGEREAIAEGLNMDPSVWDNPQAFISRLVGVDRMLAEMEQQQLEAINGNRDMVSGETRQHAMDSLHAIRAARSAFLPTRLETRDQVMQFIEQSEPGTNFTARESTVWGDQGDEDTWRIWEVPE